MSPRVSRKLLTELEKRAADLDKVVYWTDVVTSKNVRFLHKSSLSPVFSTKDRRPLITADKELRIHDYVAGILRNLDGISLALNGTEDHIHLLAKLPPIRAVSDVIRDLKANSSGWLHGVFPSLKNFSWQRGYGAFAFSHSHVDRVMNYIAQQKEHHRHVSARDEFIEFRRANAIEFDERFV